MSLKGKRISNLLSILSPIHFFDYESTMNKTHKILVGHRGAAGLAPENTLIAIQKGLENKVDRIEIDVHQTQDGKIIVMHDETLDRTTNGTGSVKSKTAAEIMNLDAGSWFSKDFEGEKIPLLVDVIKTIDAKAELVIEVKYGHDFYPNIEQNIMDIIHQNQATDWCIIHSFDTKVLTKTHQIDPKIRLHKLFVFKFPFLPILQSNKLEYFDFDAYPYIDEYSIFYRFANKGIIKRLKKMNKKVNVWTVNEVKDGKSLRALGVDGIITDFPNKVK